MAQYKTPGVYIQETTLLPSSITAVETAFPVFIGYTEKAERLENANGKTTPLTNVATRIQNLVDYEYMFGGPPAEEVTLWLNAENNIVDAAVNQAFYLYHSLRLLYSNGFNGPCMIVSVGDYSSHTTHTALLQGLEVIKDIIGPTIIAMPEAVLLEDHGAIVYAAALAQCAEVRNRMTICDLGYQNENNAFAREVEAFRDNIGFEHLEYSAAYGPWLLTSFTREPRLGNLVIKRKVIENGTEQADELLDASLLLNQLTGDADLKNKIMDLSLTERVCKRLTIGEKRLLKNAPALKQTAAILATKVTALNSPDTTDYQPPLQAQSSWFFTLLETLSTVVTDCPDTALISFAGNITSQAQARMADSMRLLVAHHHALLAHTGLILIDETATCALLGLKDQAAVLAVSPLPAVEADYVAAQTDTARIMVAQQALNGIINKAIDWFSELQLSAKTTSRALNQFLYQQNSLFRTWVDRATLALNTLPACGAVAGIYAQVDLTRGVWKAPANVALNEIIRPVVDIKDQEHDDYNVHDSGKSINIIRAFTGKGTLIWGARTLAGNDDEWRYVSVRRFFNFIEASITQSIQAFVFEPNDANTWVKVKAMIENFLSDQWRAGALQGASPEHAFYVAVGLNKTMTALDITEGRMLIEVGMASVRPAEFITLRFNLKMEENKT